jgi:hypothetical protein
MKSFQTLYTELQTMTGDTSSARLAQFKSWINDTDSAVLTATRWAFLEDTKTQLTVASQEGYEIPVTLDKIASVTITVGTKVYRPKPVESYKFYEYLKSLQSIVYSDIPQYFYRIGNQIKIFPIPQTAGNTITIRGRKSRYDLSLDDYTTGTIVTATNADETIVGSGSSWTVGTIGNHLRISRTTGDFRWYEIDSITDTTNLELVQPYNGTSIVAGSATYTIGEMSLIPSDFHNLLLYRPLALYYQMLENIGMATSYWRLYDGGLEAGLSTSTGGMLKSMMDDFSGNFEGVYMDERQTRDLSMQDLSINNSHFTGESGWGI